MGEARQVMDRLTEAVFANDSEAAAKIYAPDAVAVTPDQGELKGGEQIAAYMRELFTAFPDIQYEATHKHESGNTAIDEGYITGTNTGALRMPSGEELPPTGKRVSVRGCDAITVENGLVTSHRFYFDQMELLGQLGLVPQ